MRGERRLGREQEAVDALQGHAKLSARLHRAHKEQHLRMGYGCTCVVRRGRWHSMRAHPTQAMIICGQPCTRPVLLRTMYSLGRCSSDSE